MSMETRKVQLTGSSTFTISLPKGWASEQGIEPGMRLGLHPSGDGALVIDTGRAADARSTTVDCSGRSAAAVSRTVLACYAAGFDSVTLAFEDDAGERRRTVSRTVDRLVGLAVVHESATEIRLRNLLDAPELSIERTIVQLQYGALSMQQSAFGALGRESGEHVADVRDRADAVERRFAVVDRYCSDGVADLETGEALGTGRHRLLQYSHTARDLRGVARAASRLADRAADREDTPGWHDDVAALARRSRTAVEDAVVALLERDRGAAHAVFASASDLSSEVESSFDASYAADPGAPFLLARCLGAIERTIACAEAVASRGLCASLRD